MGLLMPMRVLGCAIAAGLFGSTALADGVASVDRPLTLPRRDVDVTYELTQAGGTEQPPLSQRMRWTAAGQRLRVDTPSPGLYVIMDYAAHLLSAVRPAEQMVLQITSDGGGLPLAATGASYLRQGDATVAGLPCTEWQTQDASGQTARICLTSDGVMLRARIGTATVVHAVRVTYAPLAAELFEVPKDYRRAAPPGAVR